MEKSGAYGGNARSIGGLILGGLRTTSCMIALTIAIALLAVRKVFS